MQAQLHNMHLLFDPNRIHPHVLFPLPPADDAIFENRIEIDQVAQDVHKAMVRNFASMITIQATALVHVLHKNVTAKKFIRQNEIDPVQIFRDLDSMWIQQNMMTKGEFVTRFFKLKLNTSDFYYQFDDDFGT